MITSHYDCLPKTFWLMTLTDHLSCRAGWRQRILQRFNQSILLDYVICYMLLKI